MFSNNRGRDTGFAAPTAPGPNGSNGKRGMFSVLGNDVMIVGNIHASADLHIDGKVEGDVRCGALVQGGDSEIRGNVYAETARLAGLIEGTVSVRQLTVERAARITGDVEYETISIENGAAIDGRLKHIVANSGKPFGAPPPPALAAPAQPAELSAEDGA
ncbi:polymer-forming cytoskeletal protein [Sphingomonas sp.]|uniref:bactofilin family protein n=1 Tax=Sphingomonas sp. TaxID=28214 RepID=UPI001D40188B|nr:polymer-forming cytoskeletal protein [Sphingomonas sp.]MBX9797312.1 polymer-forming cytoskeletal protein [Sphingomonas sp.]